MTLEQAKALADSLVVEWEQAFGKIEATHGRVGGQYARAGLVTGIAALVRANAAEQAAERSPA